jgi:hypothetical protein
LDTDVQFVEPSAPGFVDRRAKVWLECNGEPYDHRSVQVLGAGDLIDGAAFVKFVCPRCGQAHQSLLFR